MATEQLAVRAGQAGPVGAAAGLVPVAEAVALAGATAGFVAVSGALAGCMSG